MINPLAIVTGAAHRLGREMARHLAERGYALALHYHTSREAAAALQADMIADGAKAGLFGADLGDAAQAEQLVSNVTQEMGAPSLLINNASLFLRDDWHDFAATDWQAQMNVNALAPVLLARHFAGATPAAGGQIVNLLDERVARQSPAFFSYAMSKAALAAATPMLAKALAPRVRVNAIAPGLVLDSGHPSAAAFGKAHRNTLLQRGPDATAVVRALDYLLDATDVTGQVLYVDGGKNLMG